MPIKTVDVATLKQWMDKNEAIVIDVREPAEYEAGNIPGATLIPLATVSKAKIPLSGSKKVVVHCRSGKRSLNACELLLAEDPSLELYNLEGGITAWDQLQPSTQREETSFLPLEQQVQVTVGITVLFASLMGFFINHWWFLLSGFLGAGLSYAGVTGSCYLGMLLAKMPWNKGKPKSGACCG